MWTSGFYSVDSKSTKIFSKSYLKFRMMTNIMKNQLNSYVKIFYYLNYRSYYLHTSKD
ncbi:hypothetical protein C1645_815615 [Glomus cerebriforme]|uniref:Uncharacterized protein n=1 Tax=Glomus cerebriforme TaxID=658196 RepID=A0A397TIH2_9GLOM|nr:hypothetical protein C1645_815615 [Glomus cerebriforme]